jgi:hypothetical protein
MSKRRMTPRYKNPLSGVIRLAASPIFFLLAGLNFAQREGMEALMVATCRNPIRETLSDLGFSTPQTIYSALGSMWVMYLLMGVFHLSAWIDALSRSRHETGS